MRAGKYEKAVDERHAFTPAKTIDRQDNTYINSVQRNLERCLPDDVQTVRSLVALLARCYSEPEMLQFRLVKAATSNGEPKVEDEVEESAPLEESSHESDSLKWNRVRKSAMLEVVVKWDCDVARLWKLVSWPPPETRRGEDERRQYAALTKAQLLVKYEKIHGKAKKSIKKDELIEKIVAHEVLSHAEVIPVQRGPSTERTVILGNLPLDVTESAVRKALKPCGVTRCVELRVPKIPVAERPRLRKKKNVEVKKSDSMELKRKQANFRESQVRPNDCHAVVEFEEDAGYTVATREAPRIFGITFSERDEKGNWIGRPAFPQRACDKTSLMLRGLSWSMTNEKVARHVGQVLSTSHSGSFPCSLRVEVGHSPLVLNVTSNGTEWEHSPANEEETKLSEGAVCLRFESFEHAFLARQVLSGKMTGDFAGVSCEFIAQPPMLHNKGPMGEILDHLRLYEFTSSF